LREVLVQKNKKCDPNLPAKDPFWFRECFLMPMPLGQKAGNLRELLHLLREVDEAVLYYHLLQSRLTVTQPVDFHQRAQLLHDVKMKEKKAPGVLIRELLPHWQNGAVKLYTKYKALNFRQAHPDLFIRGDYIPIMVKGPQSQQVVALARRQENSWAVVAAARFFTKILPGAAFTFDPRVWQASCLCLPPDAPKEWGNIFTGDTIKFQSQAQAQSLDLAHLFQHLPVALLFGRAD
jgi:(1->4)-alpha-D-glucan 1-alpha-D-glucosylmutase